MPPVTFRSTFTRVLSVVAWGLLGALALGALLTPGALAVAPGLVLGAASGAALVWALLWSPCVTVDDEGTEVTNVLVRYRVPWAALIHVDTHYALTLHTPRRRIRATAAPAPGAVGSLRAARAQRRSEPVTRPGVRPGDLPATDSGRAAELVRGRWHRLRDSGRIEAGLAEATPVDVRPRIETIATIVLAIAGLAGAALLV